MNTCRWLAINNQDRLQPVHHIDRRSIYGSGLCNRDFTLARKQFILAGEPAVGLATLACHGYRLAGGLIGLRGHVRPCAVMAA